MNQLHWELSVLSKAVAYNNLSGAASHVGLSQPQLSRIIHKIESELGVVVLDRGVRRKSSFTPIAHRLAETYTRSIRNMTSEIEQIVEGTEPRQLTIGTLEGLYATAALFGKSLFARTGVKMLELDVYDLNQLEEVFFRGDLDFILTSREPGRKKFSHSKVIGYQSLKQVERPGDLQVMSSYEYGSQALKKKPGEARIVISNSLAIRKHWIENFGGSGVIPSIIKKTRESASDTPAYLIANDNLGPTLWEKVKEGI